MRIALIALCFSPLLLQDPQDPEKNGLKIYISADMEGVAGAVTGEQLGPTGFEYERFRRFMTDEVNAAIGAAKRHGATEILVSDSHGNGQNLLIELLPPDVRVIRSWPRPLMMMEGIDASFDGAIFIGYHTATTNSKGVRAHTMSSANITGVRLNGVAVSEAGINAAIAGHFDVPIIMVSGDDAVVSETRKLLGDVEPAAVKDSISFHSASNLHPSAARRLIRRSTATAMDRIADFKPYKPEPPFQVDLSLKHYQPAELLAYLPNVERIDSHTVRFVGKDMIEVSRFLEFVLKYRIDLQP